MALVYSPHTTTLLVVGSTASCECGSKKTGDEPLQWNFDQDAEKIYNTFIKGGKFIDAPQAQLILSSSSDCNKECVLNTVNQVHRASGEDSLFVLVYTGRACDSWEHGQGFEFKEEGSFVNISPSASQKRYSLVLNHHCPMSPETNVSGDIIAGALRKGNPDQIFIILECPFAKEIAKDLNQSLSDCRYFEIVVPLRNSRVPCYYHTLQCSTFAFFFNLVMKKTQFIKGMFPIKYVWTSVKRCCEALSSLDMIQDGDWIKKNATIPEAQFFQIQFRAQYKPERTEKVNVGDLSYDEVDGNFRFQSLIERFYRWNGRRNTEKICTEAVDWSRAVTDVYLRVLKSENVLEGTVLEAVIGSIVYSIATIQIGKRTGSFLNFFIQAFMLAVAAVDFVDPENEELSKDSLVVSASVYYQKAMESCTSYNNKEMSELVEALTGI